MYNFKKNAKLYIVELDATGSALKQHSIEIYSDITASQTFDEQGYKRKTLHNLTDLHDYAVVNNANVANFSFTTPVLNITTTNATTPPAACMRPAWPTPIPTASWT